MFIGLKKEGSETTQWFQPYGACAIGPCFIPSKKLIYK
jgi:hypothetical protein